MLSANYRRLITGCMLCVGATSHANSLEEAFLLNENNLPKWNQRNKELMWVEDYMLRNTWMDPSITHWLNQALDRDIINQANRYLQASMNMRSQFAPAHIEEMKMFHTKLDLTLSIIPPLEVESYANLMLPTGIWESLQINQIYQHPGYLHSDASLQHASLHMENNDNPMPLDHENVMIKIHSKQSRPAMELTEGAHAQYLQTRNSRFRIVNKGIHPETNVKLLEWQEVTPATTPRETPIYTMLDNQLHPVHSGQACVNPASR